jgi:hypothetical protein
MHSWKKLIACGAMLAVLLVSSCGDWDLESGNSGNNKKFTQDLRGTWITTNQNERYIGKLVIGTNQITVTGFDEYPPYYGYNDSQRPFRNLNTGYPLNGYSEVGEARGHGKIFIQYKGEWLDGILYYYESIGSPDYVNLLYFDFNGREQVMVKQK